ncbi:MAG: hypothetical protein J5764_03915 [Bacteroidales bacterium]|nr:hypothetical protein [Bacteroidales bacterium]
MKLRSLFAFLLISACGVQTPDETPGFELNAVIDAGSRVALDGVKMLWQDNDAIVLNGIVSSSVSISGGGSVASFSFPEDPGAPYYALSPASQYKQNGVITLPGQQHWVDGGIDPSTALLYGVSQTNPDIAFHIGVAFMRITINGGDKGHAVKRIELSPVGDGQMCGDFRFSDESSLVAVAGSGSAGVSVSCEGGMPLGSSVVAAIAPGSYAEGVKLRIVDECNHYQDVVSHKSFTAVAGVVYNTTVSFTPAGTLIDSSISEGTEGGEIPTVTVNTVRVGIMGDSISTFKGWIPSNFAAYYPHTNSTNGKSLTEVEQTWWYRLIYDLMPKATLDMNLSYSASFVTKLDDGNARDNWTFPTRCAMYENPDIVIIHGGTNDRGKSRGAMVPLGTYDFDTPVDELDIRAFRSAYIKTILQLQANYPGVKVVCLINSVLYQENTEDETKNYLRLAESIQTIADHYDLPVVSLKDLSYGTLDGLHPDPSGSLVIAKKVYSRLAEENLLYYKR